MMLIHVLFFAQLRDAVCADERAMNVNDAATVGEVVRELFEDEKLQKYRDLPVRFAVNEHFVEEAAGLCSQDRLAIIPPVAGGS